MMKERLMNLKKGLFSLLMSDLPIIGLIAVLFFVAILCGCASDALVVTLSDSTNTHILDFSSNDSLKIPVIAYRTGPYFFCRARKFNNGCYIRGTASITNETSTLFGMFTGHEQKDIDLEVFIASPSTNMTETADRTERTN